MLNDDDILKAANDIVSATDVGREMCAQQKMDTEYWNFILPQDEEDEDDAPPEGIDPEVWKRMVKATEELAKFLRNLDDDNDDSGDEDE